MTYDSVPAAIAAAAISVAPLLPGPSRDEWAGAVAAFAALLLRELVWWIRNGRSK